MQNCRISPDLKASSSHSKYEYGEPRALNLGCRIFISHSGKDKRFVRHLHDKLVDKVYCDRRLVFFDEESLPTAEPITMENILAEARGCELGILVLTKDFFLSTPNPMLELEALTSSNVRLLPLFFGISVDEFKKKKCENEWEERWKEWLKGDEQRLGAWKHALNYVDRFSGLEKCKLGKNELDYIHEIVIEVALIVRPAVSFSEKGVCGMDRICKEVDDMYIQCALKRTSHSQTQVVSASASTVWGDDSNSSLDLVGIYGFAGLGKSTLCRGLCDFYAADFRGRVFYLDLGSVPESSQTTSQTYSSKSAFMERMQNLLSKLTGSNDHIQYTDFYQIQNLLRNWIRRDRIFLAIDNILLEISQAEAAFYLDCEFARGSKVLITSRSGELLEEMMKGYTKFSAMIKHIPKLTLEEARDIFVCEISKLGQISDVEDEVKECVNVCVIYTQMKWFGALDYDSKCYHPLMLKSSAASITHFRRRKEDLKSRLKGFLQSAPAVNNSNAWETAFKMLDITYGILQENEKKVFLDLALFYKVIYSQSGWGGQIYTWIQTVHWHLDKNKLDDILLSLEHLSFVVMKNNLDPLSGLRLHGLMVDFSMYKIKQGADATGFNPHFLLLDNITQSRNSTFDFLLTKLGTINEWPSKLNALNSVRTISVSRCAERRDSGAQELEQLDLRNFEGVEVLYLVDNPGLHEVLLSYNTIAHLRSFIVSVRDSLRCTIDECWPMPNQTMTGGQLVWVELHGNIILSTYRKRPWWKKLSRVSSEHSMDGLGILRPFLCNLQYLGLSKFPAKSIDVTTCTNLIRMQLKWMPSLRVIHGLETLTNLKELDIDRCGSEVIDVTTCTNLQKMRLLNMARLRVIHAVETLTDLYIGNCDSLERMSLPRISNAGKLHIWDCPVLKNVGGLLLDRCFGDCTCLDVAIQDLVSVEIGSSKFKATVTELELSQEKRVQGLARLTWMGAKDVQHVGPFISALLIARATRLDYLSLWCKKDGDCGCFEIGPHLGPGLLPLRYFNYHCSQVRSIASLPLLLTNRLKWLDLSGCSNVEVWPDFATMPSLEQLNLRNTSLKEWPTGVQLLRQLRVLDIRGCCQLPAEELMNAITCSPLGCNSACGRGSLASLLADLNDCTRDRGSVADALDSRWPEIALLFREQWRYLRNPYETSCPLQHVGFLRHTELCYLIRIMYYLWFGVEGQAGSAHKDCCPSVDGVPRINEKLKRLLCSENFMSLPFYVWRIGRTRVHALDEWERYPWQEGYEIYMAFALLGSASIGCFNAPINDDLKDRMVNFIQSCVEAQPQRAVNNDFDMLNVQLNITASRNVAYANPNYLDRDAHERLAMRVGNAVCQMARAPSVVAALGQDLKFKHINVDGLKASYNTIEIPEEDVYENLIKWMRFTSRDAADGLVKMSGVIAELHKASVHTMSLDDDLGARVLHKIMPKILSISSVDFHGAIDGVNDENCCCRKSKCHHQMSKGKRATKACCYRCDGWCQ